MPVDELAEGVSGESLRGLAEILRMIILERSQVPAQTLELSLQCARAQHRPFELALLKDGADRRAEGRQHEHAEKQGELEALVVGAERGFDAVPEGCDQVQETSEGGEPEQDRGDVMQMLMEMVPSRDGFLVIVDLRSQ